MDKNVVKLKNVIILMLVFYTISFFSLSLLVMIPLIKGNSQIVLEYVVALIFWMGLILGVISIFIANHYGRRINKNLQRNNLGVKQVLPGMFFFSKKKEHLLLYLLMVIGFFLMVSDIIWHWASSYFMFPIISITLFLFTVHCVIDGVNYKIYKSTKEGKNNEHKC